MSAEPSARVTDEAVQHIVVHGRVPTGGLATQYEIRLANALAEERLCTANLDTMGRATEAKLTAALAEVERLTADADEAIAGLSDARDQYRRASHENHQRATAAESALAATKAKLEAAEKALTTHVLLPRVPTSGLIGIIEREQYPADYLKGVELRTKWPFGVVLAKTETEIAAGQYQRLVDECATLTTKETTDAK